MNRFSYVSGQNISWDEVRLSEEYFTSLMYSKPVRPKLEYIKRLCPGLVDSKDIIWHGWVQKYEDEKCRVQWHRTMYDYLPRNNIHRDNLEFIYEQE